MSDPVARIVTAEIVRGKPMPPARAVPEQPAEAFVSRNDRGKRRVEVLRDPAPFAPHPVMMLHVLWAAELHQEVVLAGLHQGTKPLACRKAVDLLLRHLTGAEIMAAVCRQLRARDALWRADPPVVWGKPDGR